MNDELTATGGSQNLAFGKHRRHLENISFVPGVTYVLYWLFHPWWWEDIKFALLSVWATSPAKVPNGFGWNFTQGQSVPNTASRILVAIRSGELDKNVPWGDIVSVLYWPTCWLFHCLLIAYQSSEYTLGHSLFGLVLSLSRVATCTHRPQGVIIVGIYISSNIYYYYYT